MSTRIQPALPRLTPAQDGGDWRHGSLLPLLLAFGLLKLGLQVALTALSIHAGYGIYRDELYYLVCGHHLALGYVDQPPLVALQARLAESLFGYHNLVAFRLLPALAGAFTVMLTGLIATALGGTRKAAALAMLAVTTAPVLLATQSFVSMNAWDPVFWMAVVLAALRLLAVPEARRWWLLLGAGAGLALENKSSAVFLLAALLLGLLATPARRLFRQPGFWLAAGLALLFALPNLWWQVVHGYPTWEWLRAVQHSDKDAVLSWPQFLLEQVVMLSPPQALLWLPGIFWLLFAPLARPWRALGACCVFFVAIMLGLHAKDYYLAPIYPLPLAAGAVLWTEWAAASRARNRLLAAYAAVITFFVFLTVPYAIPILTPARYFSYTHLLHFEPVDSEQHPTTPMPEFFADHLGWQALANQVSRVYHALPPDQQRQTGIIASNYGQASALNILGRPLGLPVAISGHQNYWLWGARGYSGKEMIVVTDEHPAEMLRLYHSCTLAARETSPYQMPWEQRFLYVCHDRRAPFATSWGAVKLYR